MVLNSRKGVEKDQGCPDCGRPVKFKVEGESLKLFNLDGELHSCREKRPIGQALVGRLIEGFNLRDRRAQIMMDGGAILEIYAVGYRPLKLRLITRDGILEE